MQMGLTEMDVPCIKTETPYLFYCLLPEEKIRSTLLRVIQIDTSIRKPGVVVLEGAASHI